MADPARFVNCDAAFPRTLLDQRAAGKKLCLITNSDWIYTQAVIIVSQILLLIIIIIVVVVVVVIIIASTTPTTQPSNRHPPLSHGRRS